MIAGTRDTYHTYRRRFTTAVQPVCSRTAVCSTAVLHRGCNLSCVDGWLRQQRDRAMSKQPSINSIDYVLIVLIVRSINSINSINSIDSIDTILIVLIVLTVLIVLIVLTVLIVLIALIVYLVNSINSINSIDSISSSKMTPQDENVRTVCQ